VFEAGCIPANEWSPAGDLLLDCDCHPETVLQHLAVGIGQSPWQLLWLDHVPFEARHWQAFRAAVAATGNAHASRHQLDVGMIDVRGDWETYRRSWSKNHRRNVSKAFGRLQREGRIDLEFHASAADDATESLLRRAFDIEDRSWKGKAGTSVLRSAGMFQFFLDQAKLLTADGQLRVALLNYEGQPIAFEYGLWAKGIYHSLKVGYDERFARYSPGQLLMHAILERLFREPDTDYYDCMGPLSGAVEKWRPGTYPLGRLVIAPPNLLGRLILHAYTFWWPRIGRLLPKRYAAQRTGERSA
jgi:hypothetical protein